MIRLALIVVVAFSVLLPSCARKETASGEGQRATVTMRDGGQMAGTVVSSSSTEIKLEGDDKVMHTIPMAQVRSVEYGDLSAAAQPQPESQAPAPEAQPAQEAQPAARPRAMTPAQPQGAPPAPPKQAAVPTRQELPRPTEAQITSRTYELPAGTDLPIRTDETIDSAKAVEGQTFSAQITEDVKDGQGNVVIPRGADARIVIRSASQGGRIRGASDLMLDLQSVAVGGRLYQISTAEVQQKGKSGVGANKRTATYTGGGAAVGAIIGAIAGGGKGAAIGAGAGAGAGALTQILTKGNAIKVPAESLLTFRLDQPLRVSAAR